MYIRSEQGTPAPLWWGEHAGQGTASHEAAPVTNSNGVSQGLERCQSSTGLRDKTHHEGKNKNEFKLYHIKILTLWANQAHLWQVSVYGEQRTVCAYQPETCRDPHHSVCPLPLWHTPQQRTACNRVTKILLQKNKHSTDWIMSCAHLFSGILYIIYLITQINYKVYLTAQWWILLGKKLK